MTPHVHGRMESFPTHHRPESGLESLTTGRAIRFICLDATVIDIPSSSSPRSLQLAAFSFFLPVFLPTLHLYLSQKSVGWLPGNMAPGVRDAGKHNTECNLGNHISREAPGTLSIKPELFLGASFALQESVLWPLSFPQVP